MVKAFNKIYFEIILENLFKKFYKVIPSNIKIFLYYFYYNFKKK